jgi:uncharacterized sulfatase
MKIVNKVNLSVVITLSLIGCNKEQKNKRPNILFAISDDQSFYHTSFNGCKFVKTPAFDRVAKEGVVFTNCYAGSPGCAPSRSSIVTGRYPWQNEQSGQHASSWMKKYVPFVDLLDKNGYATGRTGKGVAPFKYASSPKDSLFRKGDAAGKTYSNIKYSKEKDERFAKGITNLNYFENFKYFVENIKGEKPFFFWYGSKEPHRSYEYKSWKRYKKDLAQVEVPGFLPDNDEIRGDLLDYAVEIEWFDLHLQRMINYLEKIGELENTIVIVTSDNGMPFPRAKANCYEYGAHVPFAVRYPKEFPVNRKIENPTSFIDIAPTILELTKTSAKGMMPITGKSILSILRDKNQGVINGGRQYAMSGRERHSSSRYKNYGYPQRFIRMGDFGLVWNMKPNRWPAGAPQRYNPKDKSKLMPMYGLDKNGKYIHNSAFTDIDDCPSKTHIIENYKCEDKMDYFKLAHEKRPEFELYNMVNDPFCLNNLSQKLEYVSIEKDMKNKLLEELKATNDPRIVGENKEIFDTYKRYSPIRKFPSN